MTDALDRLLTNPAIKKGKSAPQAAIENVTLKYVTSLPQCLLKLWTCGDGISLPTIEAHIIGPTELLGLIDTGGWPDELVKLGYLPIFDDQNSNYLAIAVHPPLAPRILYLPHGDSGRLIYRSMDGFANDVNECLNTESRADLFYFVAEGDYTADTPRPWKDQDAAKELMKTDCYNSEWNFAAQLLDEGNLIEWAVLLETDHFVRRDVRERMSKMSSPAIRELLQRDQQAFDGFIRTALDAMRVAGLTVGKEGVVSQIGGLWIQMEGFFYRRNVPNALPRMVQWIEDLIANRDPHARSGHFMAD